MNTLVHGLVVRSRRLGRAHARKKVWLMWLLPAIVGVEFLESGMFVFAASHIAGGIGAAPREFAWVLAAYAIGSMVMIAMQQWLARHFGYRPYLIGALWLFLLGGVGSALADNLWALAVARAVQGFGGGALFTSSRVLVNLLFPPAERGKALRVFIGVLLGMASVGPMAAAWLVDEWGWRWVFVAPVPLVLLVIAGVHVWLPARVGRSDEPVRWAAGPLLLFALAITLVQFGLSEARYDMFSNPLHLVVVMGLGAVLLAWFMAHQWGHDEPLLRLRELRHPVFLIGLAFYFVHYCLANASSYLFPIYAERGLDLPIVSVGFLNSFASVVSCGVALAYVSWGVAWPHKRVWMALGAVALAWSAWQFAQLPPDSPWQALVPALVAKGVFGSLFVLPVAGLTFADLGDHRFAPGYQGKNLMRQLAASFGTSVSSISLADLQFASRTHVLDTIQTSTTSNWVTGLQSAFAARGFEQGQAHAAAMATLSKLVERQALVLACGRLYQVFAIVSVMVLGAVLLQRKFK